MTEGANTGLAQVNEVVQELRRVQGDDIAVVLVGSAARRVLTATSDIDLLVISNAQPRPSQHFPGFHIQTSSEAAFLLNLTAGEDFEAWCVRFGETLYDSGVWAKIRETPAASTWPNWRTKVLHGVRRLFLASTLLQMGDNSAAAEETVYVLGHAARGILLRMGIFPLSRPELANQIRDAGYPHLAEIHEQLRQSSEVSVHNLELAQLYSKKLLVHLEPALYAQYARDYHKKLKSKRKS